MNRGPSAASLELSESQGKLLTQYAHKHTVSRQLHQRISIVLRAHQGESNMHIARLLGVTSNTVKKWRTRWIASYERLCAHQQQTERESEHLQQMLAVLEDAPRSGSPMRISLAEKQGLMALACQKPEDFGIPVTQWNREMLAQVAQRQGIVKKISPRYVGKLLKNPPTAAP